MRIIMSQCETRSKKSRSTQFIKYTNTKGVEKKQTMHANPIPRNRKKGSSTISSAECKNNPANATQTVMKKESHTKKI